MKGLIAAGALAIFAPCALSAEPAYLSAEEVRSLIVGNTAEIDPNGTPIGRVYFGADGRRLALLPEGEYAISWHVEPDGTQCVSAGATEDCARIVRNGDGSYSRVRDGQVVTRWLRILPGKALGSLAQGVFVRELGPNKYLVQLLGPASLTEKQAHETVGRAAASLCKAQVPVLGVYRYETTQRLDAAPDAGGPNGLRFTQELSCVVGVQEKPVQRGPALRSTEESQDLQRQIRARSEAYFKMLADDRVDDAYAEVDGEGMGVDAATWKSQKRSLQTLAGRPVQISIAKITVYDNPAAAARPGLYIAADYVNEYQNTPLYCGYLMWFRPANGEFRIIREETGYMTAADYKGLPAADLPATRSKLRCVQ